MKSLHPVPDLDLAGPSVDDDIRRLFRRYGEEKVREAIKRQTARSRGPIPKADWPELINILREDARVWLEGGEPFTARSNRSIAIDFAEKHPGQSRASTRDRLMRKLRERRRYYTLAEAEWLSQAQFPYTENLRAIRALLEIGILYDLWGRLLRLRESSLADYRAKFGEPPASMTMQALIAEAGRPIAPTRASNVLQAIRGSNPIR